MNANEITEALIAEIHATGPIPFRRFMEVALYHPGSGYYRGARDPFGKSGDFYTAEQLQPAFGILIAQYVRELKEKLGSPDDFTVVELGAGREEMREYFEEFRYIPVDVGRGELPERFRGIVFANEFFDALPVDVAVRRGNGFREMRVEWKDDQFCWMEGEPVSAEAAEYLEMYAGSDEEGALREVNLEALRWLERVAQCLECGYVFAIDYGYTMRELVRFPQGTLMSYRRHTASDDVLRKPGDRDITAHVNFSALQAHAALHGLKQDTFETLSLALLRAGEKDNFASVIEVGDEAERVRRRLQLKTLLYGMGETFRTLLLKKACTK